MATYRIPVREISYGAMFVEANSLEEVHRIIEEGNIDGTEDYQWYNSETEFYDTEFVGTIEVVERNK